MKDLEKTKIFEELKEMKKNKEEKVKSKKKNTIIINIFIVLTLLSSISKMVLDIINKNGTNVIINDLLLFLIIILFSISLLIKDKLKLMFSVSAYILTIGMIGFNLIDTKVISVSLMPSFTNTSVSDAIAWATGNNIEYEQVYEYSDNVPEFNIISQSIDPNSSLDGVTKIVFTVSSGPNYDKQVIISNMVGWNLDDALKYIDENYLSNVTISFVTNEEAEKDVIVEQNLKGQIRRNDSLTLKVSIADGVFSTITMENLKDKSLFDAKVWLGRNIVSYKLEYQFSDTVKRNHIIGQSIKEGTTLNATDQVTLIVSKGKEIIVPNLSTMTVEEITNWIVDNKLKVKYSDEYSETLELGKLISSNVKENDVIEEGTEVSLVVSKGQLKMPKFTSLSEFRDWATKYNIQTEEVYEFNDIAKGNIIKFSHEENAIISPTAVVKVYISNGKAVTIPNFVGKSMSTIRTSCTSIGLKCTFSYSGYSSAGKDIALAQNKKAGSQVISGTYVNISLSKGSAQTFTIEINESQLSIGNASQTISSLKSYFSSKYPDVTFTFIQKASNVYTNAGFVHESSPIKDGSKVTQGNTYQVWITN